MLNIWRLGRVRDTKFCTDVSNKIILNAAKCQGYSFAVSELLRENQQVNPLPPRLTPEYLRRRSSTNQQRKKGIINSIYIAFNKDNGVYRRNRETKGH